MGSLIEFKPEELVIPAGGNRISFDWIQLVPGINHQLTAEQVEKLIAHPDLPRYIGKGIKIHEAESVPVVEEIDPTANADHADLSAFPVDKTDDIILATHDLAAIERWLAVEKRVTVRRQLQNRIEAIKGGRA